MSKRNPVVRARKAIATLRSRIANGPLPHASNEWGGANVIIVTATRGGRYREIVTPHALEVSWLFNNLRDAFGDLVDGCSKFELYGRFEISANAAIRRHRDVSAVVVCAAILDEADGILDEMAGGRFEVLPIALGVTIAHDYVVSR